MAVDVRAALTRKLGPLPAWGWGVALGGGILAYRFVRGGSSSGQQAAASGEPIANPLTGALPSEGYLNDLLQRLETAQANAAVQQPPAITTQPTGTGNGAVLAPPPPSPSPSVSALDKIALLQIEQQINDPAVLASLSDQQRSMLASLGDKAPSVIHSLYKVQ